LKSRDYARQMNDENSFILKKIMDLFERKALFFFFI
jgi:hypothetical protein